MSRFFGRINQNGYVVRDIEAAMHHWAKVLGVGPWFYIERHKPHSFSYRGHPSEVEGSAAFANWGDLQIELIQPRNDAPSMFKDFLDSGNEGLQHVSHWTVDYQAVYDRALALGYEVGQEGQFNGERFAYFDTELHPGTILEISDISGPRRLFFEQVRQSAVDWDGTNPIRFVSM